MVSAGEPGFLGLLWVAHLLVLADWVLLGGEEVSNNVREVCPQVAKHLSNRRGRSLWEISAAPLW